MPLPQFEADADPERRSALTVAEQAARLQKPSTIVVKYGDLGWVGEYAWEGDASPGCGSKILCKTHRGTEIGEMLTKNCKICRLLRKSTKTLSNFVKMVQKP